jgi:hypothetical protein
MAIITDVVIPEHVVPQTYERQTLRVKLNGPGGQFPSATIVAGDLIHSAFKKNGAANFSQLQDSYQVAINPSAGKRLIAYYILRIVEEDIQEG